MGVPVFNVLVGAAAGVYTGRKAKINGQDWRKFREVLKKTAVLATFVLLAVCSFSAFAALVDNSTAANLQGMLHLGFEITRMMIWFLIVLGILALAGSYYLCNSVYITNIQVPNHNTTLLPKWKKLPLCGMV